MPTDTANGTVPLIERILDGSESPISVKQMCADPAFCRDGRPMAIGRAYRLIYSGKIESAKVAGALVTTRGAIRRYLLAVNEPDLRAATRPTSQTPRRMAAAAKRAHEAALVQLAAAGFNVGKAGVAMRN